MSYVLFLGFKSIVFKEPAIVRVSLDNFFIDEFSLIPTQNCDINDIDYKSQLGKIWTKKNSELSSLTSKEKLPKNIFSNFFNKDIIFKIFELDKNFIEKIKKHNLTIEICNTSNNFTNGFMNKSTLTSLGVVHLIPKSILINTFTFCDNFIINHKKNYKNKHIDINSIVMSYKQKIVLFDLFNNNLFKNKEGYLCLKWYSTTNKKEISIKLYEWRGDKGCYNLFFDTSSVNDIHNFDRYTIRQLELHQLSNKYKEYENYGNNN